MIYVDSTRNPLGNMIMCHMVADTHEELMEAAKKLGLQASWIQNEGSPREHFDISRAVRNRAIRDLGARPVKNREMVRIIQGKRDRSNE